MENQERAKFFHDIMHALSFLDWSVMQNPMTENEYKLLLENDKVLDQLISDYEKDHNIVRHKEEVSDIHELCISFMDKVPYNKETKKMYDAVKAYCLKRYEGEGQDVQ